MNEQAITKALQTIGGKLWEKGSMRRIYFSDRALRDFIGLSLTYYKTGNIQCATLKGTLISNTKAYRIINSLSAGKIHYDLITGVFAASAPGDAIDDILQALREYLSAREKPETVDAQWIEA